MMNDRLLRELGDLARKEAEAEQARLDERWDRLAAGTLTAEEETELRALATSSPEAGEAYAAFKPLGAEFQARVASAINSQRASEAPAPQEKRPRVPPFRGVARRMEIWFGAAAVAAAGLFFLVRGPALPAYTFDTIHGNQTSRGGDPNSSSGTPVFDPDSPLAFVVRPPHSVNIPVEARGFLAHGAKLIPWEPGILGTDGTFRFEGKLSRLQPGEWKIWVVIARRGKLPSLARLQYELRADRTRTWAWQAISTDLRIQSRASP